MDPKNQSSPDETGLAILRELQANARATFSEIGRKVGLSPPAVAERVYKMEAAGIITGYHAAVNPGVLGHDILAFISLTTLSARYKEIFAFAENQGEILECHHISGNESLILKVTAQSIAHLDCLVERLGRYGETKTSIVLSSPVSKKPFLPDR